MGFDLGEFELDGAVSGYEGSVVCSCSLEFYVSVSGVFFAAQLID